MTRSWQAALLPLYLAACLVLGGSTEGIWTNLALQIGAIVLIAASLAAPADRAPRLARQLMAIIIGALILVVVQLVPLPPTLWTALPGRGFVVRGLIMTGQPLPWMPLSLAPVETLTSACFLLPPFAILLWIVRGGPLSLSATIGVMLGVGLAGAVLGLRQITSGGDLSLFFYQFSSWGKAPGFFANSSHMAALMLASMPFLAALVIDVGDRQGDSKRGIGVALAAAALSAIFMALVAINGSGAVLLLFAPVLFMTIALWGGRGVAWLRKLAVPLPQPMCMPLRVTVPAPTNSRFEPMA